MSECLFISSVQVMLFADRLKVWNPGTLPPSLRLEKLRQPHGSVPSNPLLAEPLHPTKPEEPNCRLQTYHLTAKGRGWPDAQQP